MRSTILLLPAVLLSGALLVASVAADATQAPAKKSACVQCQAERK